jgi:hypothetical protein
MMKSRWALPGLMIALLTIACSTPNTAVPEPDLLDVRANRTDQQASHDVVAPDLGTGEEVSPGEDLAVSELVEDLTPGCQPGEGCFLDDCVDNSDCLSGWCVDYLGEGVCSQACQEECPQGWSCKLLGSTGPDPVYVCLADHANLCKPCTESGDCQSAGETEDVCVSYGEGTGFCGGNCVADDDCPWGFSCLTTQTIDGIDTKQCVADAGECPCTSKSVSLTLWTGCTNANEWGTCNGKRVCTAEGLSPCDASTPARETCNGMDDDCDGDIDEPDEVGGDYVNLCDDGNECTIDTCSGEAGCTTQILDGGECKDGDACTVGDHCEAGDCVGNPVLCDDANPCTDDACDGFGGCQFTNNLASCDDNDPCTVADQCDGGGCSGVAIPCDCQNEADCLALEDGDLCNGTLTCDLAKWPYLCRVVPESVVLCPPAQGPDAPCLAPACDPESGACSLVPANDGVACDDGDLCTVGDHCDDGVCAGGGPANCADDNPCTDDHCQPLAGCVHLFNQAPCQDGDSCTANDQCLDGVCQAGDPVVCDDGNGCTDDLCSPQGGCTYTANDALCDDGNACSTGDHCAGGACVFDGWLVCDDDNICTTDSCTPEGGCTFMLNSAPCDDNDLCTTGDHCHLGECISAGNLVCDDGNLCTDDSCVAETGCEFSANTAPCDDGNSCTIDDHCLNAWCTPGAPLQCDDGNLCTDDVCDAQSGCLYPANSASCDDGDACTVGDLCAGGQCASGADVLDCDDLNPCTDDSCDSQLGCQHANNAADCDGGSCVDGDCVANCEPIVYGTAGIGVNNGWTCTDVCNDLGGVTVDWESVAEQIDICTSLHPGATHFIQTPNNFSYPIYEPQNDNCKVNQDGSQSQGFAGNGTAQYGDQILCRCAVACPCTPDCTDKACGDDGCGGSCGDCAPSQGCQDFACVDCPSGTKSFVYSGQIETYQLPPCVTQLTLELAGAEGGRNTKDNYLGGRGAAVTGTVSVPPGTTLKVIVGGKGEDVQANAGGGGGSYVWIAGATEPLMVAGGGGGGGYDNAGLDGVTTVNGTHGNGVGAGAGVDGYGGTAPAGFSYVGGGGAGWKSNGNAGKTTGGCSLATPAKRPLEGGAGGTYGGEHSHVGNGGFGGGGGGQGGCIASGGAGGGGGYSGGGPGGYLSPDIRGGGGGGSYNPGSNPQNAAGVQSGNGTVVLSW